MFLADRGVDLRLAEEASAMGFAGLMVDTGDKSAGSLLRHADPRALRALISIARRRGCLSGLAGSLGRGDVSLLRELAPDFAGFRGALCDGDRRGRLDADKVRALRMALRGEEAAASDDGDAGAGWRQRGATLPDAGVESSIRIRGNSFRPSNSIE